MLMRLIQTIGSWLFNLESRHVLSNKFIDTTVSGAIDEAIDEVIDEEVGNKGPHIALVGNQWISEDYQGIVHHEGNLVIRHNAELQNVDFLSSLETVHGDLVLFENVKLENVEGLRNLHHVVGDLVVVGNTKLNDLSGFKEGLKVDGDMQIMGNPVQKFGATTSLIPGGQMRIMNDSIPEGQIRNVRVG